MRWVRTTRKDKLIEHVPVYTIYEYPYEDINSNRIIVRKLSKTRQMVYAEQFATFDIETTSYSDGDHVRGFMYVWQMCVDGHCVYGRTWEEFITFVEAVTDRLEGLRFVIYVHNLSFEYQFMYRILHKYYKRLEVFAPQKRKPLTVRVPQRNIELRCSYKLSNMSLNKATLNEYGCPYVKALGDLDYSIYRDPSTPLSDLEMTYIVMDVLSLYHYVKAKMYNEGDDLGTIPLTSTGYVRRDCRNACKTSKSYMDLYRKNKLQPSIYALLKEAGRGGDTAANYRFAGQFMSDVDSFDVASSYPYQMIDKKYPVRRFYPYGRDVSEEEMDYLCEDRPVLARVAFKGLKHKPDCVDLYLPYSKRIIKAAKAKQANGRVMSSKAIAYALTDIDWHIVSDCYTWDDIRIYDVYTSKYDYLPLELRDVIRSYFIAKCELKERLGRMDESDPDYYNVKYLYLKSKNRLNGIFGMAYTDPVRDEVTVDYAGTGEWKEKSADVSESLKRINYYGNNFLVYAWGAWTTAHAREHLHKLISIIGDDSLYWDTDSDKCIHSVDVRRRVEEANDAIRAHCDQTGAYADVNGRRYYMGVYECETPRPYQCFKTLGAKKYAYVDHNGELHLTVSGVACHPGEPMLPDGAREMGDISNFKPGFTFYESGGLTLHYNDDPVTTLTSRTNPAVTFTCGANVGTEDSTYTIGLTGEYAKVIGINLYNKAEM